MLKFYKFPKLIIFILSSCVTNKHIIILNKYWKDESENMGSNSFAWKNEGKSKNIRFFNYYFQSSY